MSLRKELRANNWQRPDYYWEPEHEEDKAARLESIEEFEQHADEFIKNNAEAIRALFVTWGDEDAGDLLSELREEFTYSLPERKGGHS